VVRPQPDIPRIVLEGLGRAQNVGKQGTKRHPRINVYFNYRAPSTPFFHSFLALTSTLASTFSPRRKLPKSSNPSP